MKNWTPMKNKSSKRNFFKKLTQLSIIINKNNKVI